MLLLNSHAAARFNFRRVVARLRSPARHRPLTAPRSGSHQDPGNCSTPRSAIADTQHGKVRGYLDGGVFTFKGVPYGQDTGGANRWLPAKPPTPWTGERHTLIYGPNCPQTLHDFKAIETSFLFDWDDGYLGEDMLKLNIWTPSSDRQAAGDGLFPWRRLFLRLGLRIALARRRADGAAS